MEKRKPRQSKPIGASAGTEKPADRPRKLRASTTKAEDRHRMIAEAAYFKAERRDFRGGSPDQDWFEAEAEIQAMLTKTTPR